MRILVIDAQGGGIGRQLVAAIKEQIPGAMVTAVGTNSAATAAMLKAGADRAATGENAVIVNSRKADAVAGRNHAGHGRRGGAVQRETGAHPGQPLRQHRGGRG